MAQTSTNYYFGYGSNLWIDQMARRCPQSKFYGVAKLNSYSWIINKRGYANVVHNTEDRPAYFPKYPEVWGMVYSVSESDEKQLDLNEGVAHRAYDKEWLEVEFWRTEEPFSVLPDKRKPLRVIDVEAEPALVKMLVYINPDLVEKSVPKNEYIVRMNRGISDAIQVGVPKDYINAVLRRFIPDSGNISVQAQVEAEAQASSFREVLKTKHEPSASEANVD
jgi:gamma-glutamylcyclotransferase